MAGVPSDGGAPPAKRRFVVPGFSQKSAIGEAQEKRGTLLFGRTQAAATSDERWLAF